MRLSEDVNVVVQQRCQQVMAGCRVGCCRCIAANTAPTDDMISPVEIHGERIKIPYHRPQSTKPVDTNDKIEAIDR